MSAILKLGVEQNNNEIIQTCLNTSHKILCEFSLLFRDDEKTLIEKLLGCISLDDYAQVYVNNYDQLTTKYLDIKEIMMKRILRVKSLALEVCFRAINQDKYEVIREIVEDPAKIVYPDNKLFKICIENGNHPALSIIINNIPKDSHMDWNKLFDWCENSDDCRQIIMDYKEQLEKSIIKRMRYFKYNDPWISPEEFDEKDGPEHIKHELSTIINYCINSGNYVLIKHIKKYITEDIELPYDISEICWGINMKSIVLGLLSINIKHFASVIYMTPGCHETVYDQIKTFIDIGLVNPQDCIMAATYMSKCAKNQFIGEFCDNEDIDWDLTLELFLNTKSFKFVLEFVDALDACGIKYDKLILVSHILSDNNINDITKEIIKSSGIDKKKLMELITDNHQGWARFIYEF